MSETTTDTAARRWREALAQWAVPPEILAAAPESPWHFPPELFARVAQTALAQAETSVSRRVALEALPEGGTVLDVGAGGGAASLPLVPPAALLVAVDEGEGMIEVFAKAAGELGVAHREVLGRWPDVAAEVEPADVVMSHNVLYNVPDIAPFVAALNDHARHRVVIEITSEHPTTTLSPLWLALHGVVRPTTPTAADAIAAIAELGYDVHHEERSRRWPRQHEDRSDMIASLRRRLCVGPDRDAEIDALLTPEMETPERRIVTIWWDPPSG